MLPPPYDMFSKNLPNILKLIRQMFNNRAESGLDSDKSLDINYRDRSQ